MLVTIITTSLNRVWHVADAIRTVLFQTYKDLEYIIVDGGSTDGTQRVVRDTLKAHGFDMEGLDLEAGTWDYTTTLGRRRVRFVCEPDRGMYDALNKGMRLATGDVVGMLHSDDMLQDEWVLAEYVQAFVEKRADMVYADGFLVDRDNPQKILRRIVNGHYRARKLRLGWTPLHCTCMVRREAIEQYGPYNLQYSIAADNDWMIRYLRVPGFRVEYLGLRFVVRMRLGGVHTDFRHIVPLLHQDLEVFRGHGLWPVGFTKLMRVWRKVPQTVAARVREVRDYFFRK